MSLGALKSKWMSITALSIVLLSGIGGAYIGSGRGRNAASGPDASEELTDQFKEALGAVQDEYAGSIDLERLGKDSRQGIVYQFDQSSCLFTKAEFERVQNAQDSHHIA